MELYGATKGYIFTTADFGSSATASAMRSPKPIELIPGRQLAYEVLQQFKRSLEKRSLEIFKAGARIEIRTELEAEVRTEALKERQLREAMEEQHTLSTRHCPHCETVHKPDVIECRQAALARRDEGYRRRWSR